MTSLPADVLWGSRNDCVTNESQKTSVGKLTNDEIRRFWECYSKLKKTRTFQWQQTQVMDRKNETTRDLNLKLNWENSRHLATPPLVALWNEVKGTSVEIPYWWRVTRSGLCFWLEEANFQPIRSTSQIWVVTRHQSRISVLVSQSSFRGGTSEC